MPPYIRPFVFEHEVTNPNSNPTPTLTLGGRQGRGGRGARPCREISHYNASLVTLTIPLRRDTHPKTEVYFAQFTYANLHVLCPVHLSRHWPQFSPTMCLSKYVCITTIEYKHHPRRTTDHNDWPRYDSAPFWLTRTRTCATFDIRGHVWVESFHGFAHCERTMRCVHCKTTCLHNFSTYEGMYCCCCWLSGGYRFLSHHELRPSVGPVLNPYPHNGVCVCVCIGTRPSCPHMHMCVLWAVFVQFTLVRRPHCASRPQHWPSCLNFPLTSIWQHLKLWWLSGG